MRLRGLTLSCAAFGLLALAPQQPGPAAGDNWSTERSYRYLSEADAIDFTNIERTDYRVDGVDAKSISISQSRRLTSTKIGADSIPVAKETAAKTATLKFGPGGAPTYSEDTEDPIRTRVDRVQWSAAEDRRGVSWTRRFPAAGTVGGAKLTLRPTGASADSRTVAVTYVEDGGSVKGEATVILSDPKRIVGSLKMTLTGVTPPGGDKVVKVAVNQKLIDSK